MLISTHIMIAIFFSLLFLKRFDNPLIHSLILIFSTMLPDIDTEFSRLGKRKIFRPLQFFFKHRGFFHSFTFLFLLTGVLYYFFPMLAILFFAGYGLHLFADCFTIKGIQIFWPFKLRLKWKLVTGGKFETLIFAIFLLGSVLIAVHYFLEVL